MSDGAASSRTNDTFGKFRPERHHEELEIIARFEKNVVLTRLKEQ